MYLLDQRILGIMILCLLGLLVAVKQVATGSILEKPQGSLLVQVVNIFNLFFLLVVNPLAAICLIIGRSAPIDPARLPGSESWVLMAVEIVGLVLTVAGYLLMAGALIVLGRNYQLGGSTPRSVDKLVRRGPYRLVRHPMYTAALSISLGLACLIPSWVFLSVFGIYLALILPLISMEEEGLRKIYGAQYGAYQQKTKRLVPFVY
jgi:protein-S-isoprenylcysteine O-methyltransferase Ste14